MTLAPRTTWADMTRDMVASGAARAGLTVDRFSDLLVLTEQVAGDLLGAESDSEVVVSLITRDSEVEVVFESGIAPQQVTRLALERLADRHWHQPDGPTIVTGFSFGS